jgi:hypothetical protein
VLSLLLLVVLLLSMFSLLLLLLVLAMVLLSLVLVLVLALVSSAMLVPSHMFASPELLRLLVPLPVMVMVKQQ